MKRGDIIYDKKPGVVPPSLPTAAELGVQHTKADGTLSITQPLSNLSSWDSHALTGSFSNILNHTLNLQSTIQDTIQPAESSISPTAVSSFLQPTSPVQHNHTRRYPHPHEPRPSTGSQRQSSLVPRYQKQTLASQRPQSTLVNRLSRTNLLPSTHGSCQQQRNDTRPVSIKPRVVKPQPALVKVPSFSTVVSSIKNI